MAVPSRLVLGRRRGQDGQNQTEFVIYDGVIENRLHYVKDVTMGEDRSLVHVGHGPAVMSLLRDAVVSVVYRTGSSQVVARLRQYARPPEIALALLGLGSPENA